MAISRERKIALMLCLTLCANQARAQDTDAQTEVIPTSTTEAPPAQKKLPLPPFEHRVQFGQAVGLPSTLVLEMDSPDTQYVRAFLVIDGQLLVAPMIRIDSDRHWEVQLPTPKETLSYQFQLIDMNGSSLVTDSFISKRNCLIDNLERSLAVASDYPQQPQLLRQAVNLQNETSQLQYVIDTLRALQPERGAE